MAKYIVPFNTRLEQAIYDELVAICEPDDEEKGLKRVYVVNQALREWLARRRAAQVSTTADIMRRKAKNDAAMAEMELRRRGKPSKKSKR